MKPVAKLAVETFPLVMGLIAAGVLLLALATVAFTSPVGN